MFINYLSFVLVLSLILSTMVILGTGTVYAASSYYVSSTGGDNNNDGTSPVMPWKTLSKVSQQTFHSGDCIYLKKGDTWNENLILHGVGATLTSYGTSPAKPVISPGYFSNSWCVTLSAGDDNWTIDGIELCNAEQGIMFLCKDNPYNSMTIKNCYFHDLRMPTWTNQADIMCSWGTCISSDGTSAVNTSRNLLVQNCYSENCDGFMGFAQGGFTAHPTTIDGCTIKSADINPICMWNHHPNASSTQYYDQIEHSVITDIGGRKSVQWGLSAIITAGNDYGKLYDNEIGPVYRYGNDNDSCGFDFESASHHFTFQYNYFHDIAQEAIFFFSPPQYQPNTDNTNFLIDGNIFRNICNNVNNHNDTGTRYILYDFLSTQLTGTVSNNLFYHANDLGTYYNESGNAWNTTVSKTGNTDPGTASFVAQPTVSVNGGVYGSGQLVSMSCATSGAEIRYTLDGSYPNGGSTLYTGPITINETSCLNVRGFKSGMAGSYNTTNIYKISPNVVPNLLSNSDFENGTTG